MSEIKNYITEFINNHSKKIPLKNDVICLIFSKNSRGYYLEKILNQYFNKDDFGKGYIRVYTTINEMHKFIFNIYSLLKKIMKKISNFIGDRDIKIHLSSTKLENISFVENKSNYIEDVNFYNPSGLWYSCGFDYYKWWLDSLKKVDKKDIFSFNDYSRYSPFYFYELDLKTLNIKKISSCEELFDFTKKYKDNRMKKSYLSWSKIYRDYDGLELCPFVSFKCSRRIRKMYPKKKLENINDIQEEVISEISLLNYLINNKVSEKDKSIIWSYYWKAASGVIWKNYKKIIFKEFKI